MKKFFLLFFYFVSLNANQIDLNESKINQKKEQQYIFGYRECCGNNLFWCRKALDQSCNLMTSFGMIYLILRYFKRNQQGMGGEILLTQAPPFLRCVTISVSILLYPYLMKYSFQGHLKPTCYKTAFFSPSFFIEVPYFFIRIEKRTNKIIFFS